MRQCLISNKGISFKISYATYYYISYKTLSAVVSKYEIIDFLKCRFDKSRIKVNSDKEKNTFACSLCNDDET